MQGGSLEVATLEPPASAGSSGPWTWRSWTLHADFDAAGRGDAWVTADEVAGTIRFGNGNRGLRAVGLVRHRQGWSGRQGRAVLGLRRHPAGLGRLQDPAQRCQDLLIAASTPRDA